MPVILTRARAQTCVKIHTFTRLRRHTPTCCSTRKASCSLAQSSPQTAGARRSCSRTHRPYRSPLTPSLHRDALCPSRRLQHEPWGTLAREGQRCPKPQNHSERNKTDQSTFPHSLSNTPSLAWHTHVHARHFPQRGCSCREQQLRRLRVSADGVPDTQTH